MEGRRCIVVEEEAHPGRCEAPSQGRPGNDGAMGDYRGNGVALGCGCHGGAAVLAVRHDRGWLAELSSGRFCRFGGSRLLRREGSSAQRGYRTGG